MTSFVPNNKEELSYIKDQLKSRFNNYNCGWSRSSKRSYFTYWPYGKVSPFDILSVVSALEILLTDFRKENYIGKGIAQFMEVIKHAS